VVGPGRVDRLYQARLVQEAEMWPAAGGLLKIAVDSEAKRFVSMLCNNTCLILLTQQGVSGLVRRGCATSGPLVKVLAQTKPAAHGELDGRSSQILCSSFSTITRQEALGQPITN
jgi:hypothetical protein